MENCGRGGEGSFSSSSPDSNGLPMLEEFHIIWSWWETKSSFLHRNRKFSYESIFLASFAVQGWPWLRQLDTATLDPRN